MSCGRGCFAITYDVIAQIISILDVTTDIIVLVGYYESDRMVFFWLSFVIIMLALFAYTIAFISFYGDEDGVCLNIGLFCSLFLISPFIPFLFFATTDKTSRVCKFIRNCCFFRLSFDSKDVPSTDMSKLRQWMEEKIRGHVGFILEAMAEAFPQAILQMVAIVYFGEANIISTISILLSMTSVASKSFVISVATAFTFKQLFFNWLSAVTDFFGIFFAVSWVFYSPTQHSALEDTFQFIRNVWLYKLVIFLSPMIAFASIAIHVVSCWEFFHDICTRTRYVSGLYVQPSYSCVSKVCIAFGVFLFVTLCWTIGIIASVLFFEISGFVWVAFSMFAVGTSRYPESKTSSDFYFSLVHWIRSAQQVRVGGPFSGELSYTKHQDRIMRICSVNHILTRERYSIDDKLRTYLDKEIETQYLNVTLSNLRSNCSNPRSALLTQRFLEFYAELFLYEYKQYKKAKEKAVTNTNKLVQTGITCTGFGILTWILGPWYFVSKVASLFFPAFIVLYLYFQHGIILWYNSLDVIDMFQAVMITIYALLCAILCVLFYMNISEQYWMHHILPSGGLPTFTTHSSAVRLRSITDHYYSVNVIPFRKALILNIFGQDIGPIVLSYLPLKDHFASSSNQVVLVSTV